ncbi:MAG: CAP domain-containing protein [Bacillota bacterium]
MSLKKYTQICLFVCILILITATAFHFTADRESTREGAFNGEDGPDQFVLKEEGLIFYSLVYQGFEANLLDKGGKIARSEPKPGFDLTPPSEDSQPPHPARTAVAGSSGGSGVVLTGREQQMVSLINQARNSAGLPSLQVCSRTTAAARAKSRDMADNNYFSHTSPAYGPFPGVLDNYGVSYRTAAENIAWNTSGSVSSAHNEFMRSPGHRRNILGGNINYVGVGVSSGGGRLYFTQLFVGR